MLTSRQQFVDASLTCGVNEKQLSPKWEVQLTTTQAERFIYRDERRINLDRDNDLPITKPRRQAVMVSTVRGCWSNVELDRQSERQTHKLVTARSCNQGGTEPNALRKQTQRDDVNNGWMANKNKNRRNFVMFSI